ncbi:hypothetical protein [Mesorhizobium sp. WSM2239]|uniref:Baseplate protein J-like domain-containing protein n=2 Tax=unclassified Mesorhizobium TaxID=325217 RepID=A0AAU8D715_9HYPH
MFSYSAESVFRDFETDGILSSGKHYPRKVEIRSLVGALESAVTAFISKGGLLYPNKAAMDADLTRGLHQMAWVLGDPVVANNGVYRKTGGPGLGSWVRTGDLPYSFIKASNDGSGTANAIQATTPIPIPVADGGSLIVLNIFEDNTASPVTVSFNGDPPLTIKTNSGNDISIGGVTAGMIVAGYKSGTTLRLISDQASAAILAQIEALVEDAEEAAVAAQAAASSVLLTEFPTKAAAEAYAPAIAPDMLRLAGYTTAGDGGGALYKSVGSEPSHAGKFSITLSGGGVVWY